MQITCNIDRVWIRCRFVTQRTQAPSKTISRRFHELIIWNFLKTFVSYFSSSGVRGGGGFLTQVSPRLGLVFWVVAIGYFIINHSDNCEHWDTGTMGHPHVSPRALGHQAWRMGCTACRKSYWKENYFVRNHHISISVIFIVCPECAWDFSHHLCTKNLKFFWINKYFKPVCFSL